MVFQTDPKEVGKTCRFCNVDFPSFNDRIRHYYECKKFYSEFLKMEPKKRSKYMILNFLVKNPQYAPLICIGCGTIEKSAAMLHKHQGVCVDAAKIDELNRRSLYGFLPEEGIVLREPAVSLSATKQHIVTTIRNHVENIKKLGRKTTSLEKRLANSKKVPVPTQVQAGTIVIPIIMSPSTYIIDSYEVHMPLQEVNVVVHIRSKATI